jgi:Flp pilus assembly CpaF family ATPase
MGIRPARRQKIIALLEATADKQRTIYTDTESDSHNIKLTVAVRNLATCEMPIQKVKNDPWRLLELIERQLVS